MNTLLAIVLIFTAPKSTGNLSVVRNDSLFIRSTNTVSGWVVSNKVTLNNRRFKVKVSKSGWDNSFSVSPKIDLASTTGVWSEPNRLRYVIYGNPKQLYAEWKRNGVLDSRNVSPAGTDPFWLAMSFVNDSVKFERGGDGKAWTTVAKEKFNLPGCTIADSFYIEFSANKTPSGGDMILIGFQVEELSAPEPPSPPVILTGNETEIVWNKNREADLAGYRLHRGLISRQYEVHTDCKKDTVVKISGLAYETRYFFAATAYDSAGNESAYSNEISVITGKEPVSTNKFDVDNNGKVDTFDWSLLMRMIGVPSDDPIYSPRADLTNDGRVDGFDKSLFALASGVFE